MNILQFFIVPVIVVLITHVIMSVVYKDVEKVDKGFVLNEYKLTYRRRFIRAIWSIPFIFLVYFAIYLLGDLTSSEIEVIGFIFIILALLDIVYNYVMWKKDSRKTTKSLENSQDE